MDLRPGHLAHIHCHNSSYGASHFQHFQLHLFNVLTDEHKNSRGTRTQFQRKTQRVESSLATSSKLSVVVGIRRVCSVTSVSLRILQLHIRLALDWPRGGRYAVVSGGNCRFPDPGRDKPLLISVLPSFRRCDELNRIGALLDIITITITIPY